LGRIVEISSFAMWALFAFVAVVAAYPTIADPPAVSNDTVACSTELFSLSFRDYNPKPFSFRPLSCLAKSGGRRLVLSLACNVTAGRQYDRSVYIWIEGALVLAGTTSEPRKGMAPSWTVEAEVTPFTSLLTGTTVSGQVSLGTEYDSTYNGLPSCTATLLAYSDTGAKAPDVVLPFAPVPNIPAAALLQSLPLHVAAVRLSVNAQGQNVDEFWWSCVPDNLSKPLQSCPNTAFRVLEVWVNGVLVTVGPVMPFVFTGGDDPELWMPTPNAQTLLMQPQYFDLEPGFFVGGVGTQHNVTVRVGPAPNSDWFVDASLLLTLDEGVTGAGIVSHTGPPSLGATVSSTVNTTTLSGGINVDFTASFDTTAFVVYSDSRGKVTTQRTRDFLFSNVQKIATNGTSSQLADVEQRTTFFVAVSVSGGVQTDEVDVRMVSIVNVEYRNASTAVQSSNFTTEFTYLSSDYPRGYARTSSNLVEARDVLYINITGGGFSILGNKDQRSAQSFTFRDSNDNVYLATVTAANNTVTSSTSLNHVGRLVNPYQR
jgi:hypothetical protein